MELPRFEVDHINVVPPTGVKAMTTGRNISAVFKTKEDADRVRRYAKHLGKNSSQYLVELARLDMGDWHE